MVPQSLQRNLKEPFPKNFMKFVTDVYEKRSAVSLKVESCMRVLLESYWKVTGELLGSPGLQHFFHVHHIEFIHSDVF